MVLGKNIMKNVDFLILVENYKRGELENACLLGAELKKRGYKIEIRYFRDTGKMFIKPKVVIVPNCYANTEIENYAYFFRNKSIKIVDLQYEQVLSQNGEKSSFYTLSGLSKAVTHICWGKKTKERLMKYGVNEMFLPVTGFITLDLYDKKFDSLFQSKKKLAEKYSIPVDKKWTLFASNFTYVNEETFRQVEKTLGSDLCLLRTQMVKSQKVILDWFKKALIEFPDQIIIYRPHPSEIVDNTVIEMGKKYTNFFCISDYSLKQWIRYTDTMLVYYSTSIVDALYKGINSFILRPLEISEDQDVQFMIGEKHIRDENSFITLMSKNERVSLKNEAMIQEYYGAKKDYCAYKRVADACEITIKSDQTITYPSEMRSNFLKPRNIASRMLQKICTYVPLYFLFKNEKTRRMYATMDYRQNSYIRKKKRIILKKMEEIIE